MILLDRYIARVVIIGTLTALFVLSALDAFFAIVGEIGNVGKGNYDLTAAFSYVLYTLPRRAYALFPFAAMLGSLFGLGMLATNHELVAVRTAGVSIGRILFSVLLAGLFMQLIATAVGEFIAPVGEQHAQLQRQLAKYQRVTFRGASGLWARDRDNFVNIREILPGGRLGGIYVYEMDDRLQVKKVTEAHFAGYQNKQWMLFKVRQSVIEEDGVQIRSYPRLAWDTLLSPELLQVLVVAPEFLSTRDLFTYIKYMDENGLDSNQYRLAFWSNVAAPVSGLLMLFLSVPFVFGPLRTVGAGQRIFVGILVGLVFYLLNQMAGRFGQVYGISPGLSVFAPLLLFFSIGLVMMRRVR